ncbi:hypothetical protein JKP88DRAFT_270582 [Tribonema minus]|uniref:Histone-lysine N-methyltransferase n=1 Tax=Tribonema minus TaxID=303371 RepID=A0A835YR61_9STRA|nr:hypothetical protein JKP88DRAFT_270582 [Tribonema minus]
MPAIILPPTPPPADKPGARDHYRLPLRVLNDYHARPPPFLTLRALKWECPQPARSEPGEMCQCKESCRGGCLNAMLRIECVSARNEEAKGGSVNSRYANCRCGADCGNRRFQQHEVVKTVPLREEGRGWGLQVLEDVARGQLVCEYLGEVIDEETMQARLERQQRERPHDHDHYVMELTTGLYVDAKFKGSVSRLINHSCDPNCELQKWNVKGETRIGIVALRAIDAGESLSYDYQFFTNDGTKFLCRCGAPRCRGTMAPQRLDGSAGGAHDALRGRTRKELLKRAVRLDKGRVQRLISDGVASKRRLALTGRTLPGERAGGGRP